MRAMHISSDHPLLLRIVDDLYAQGWSQQNIFLPEALTLELAAECRKRSAEGELTPAAVGRGLNQEVREGIRGDHIQWLEPGEALACTTCIAQAFCSREIFYHIFVYLASVFCRKLRFFFFIFSVLWNCVFSVQDAQSHPILRVENSAVPRQQR